VRSELIAIHTVLSIFEEHAWIGIFTDSLSNLHVIRHHCNNPRMGDSPHYHHNILLLGSIATLLDLRRAQGFGTILHKILTQASIRCNDLTDAIAKLAVTYYDTLASTHTIWVDTWDIAPRPTH